MLWNCRGFKSASKSELSGDDDEAVGRYGITNRCSLLHLQLYFFCGLMLSLYVLFVYLISRIYVLRYGCHLTHTYECLYTVRISLMSSYHVIYCYC